MNSSLPTHSTRVRSWRLGIIRPYWLLVFGCCMVLALLFITYTHSRLNSEVLHLSEIDQRRIDRLDQLWLLMMEAEASAVSYLLLRDDSYLLPYRNAYAHLDPLIVAMSLDIPAESDDHADLQVLKDLVDDRFLHLSELLVQGRMAVDSSSQGRASLDDIKSKLMVLKTRRQLAHRELEFVYLSRVETIQWMGYALGLASLLLIVTLFLVQQRQVGLRARIHDLLKTENIRLEAKVTARTRELSNLASHLTNAREEERQHIARELHDEMGSALTAAKMDASWLRRSLGPQLDDHIQERILRLIENIGSTITLIRRLVDDLQPPLLKGLGLVEALRSLCEQFQMDLPVEVGLPDHDLKLSQAKSLALFRIAQESLTNIRKYAQATQVKLDLRELDGWVVLSIHDNGVGFQLEGVESQGHGHGIAGIKHRTQMFNGTLSLRSSPGQGTQIEVRMKMNDEA